MSDTPNATAMKAAKALSEPYYCWDCNSSHTASEPCNDLDSVYDTPIGDTCYRCSLPIADCRCEEELTLVGQREEPLTATVDIDCPTCGGDGEVSAPTPVNYKYDLDTVKCHTCGGKGTIGRREGS